MDNFDIHDYLEDFNKVNKRGKCKTCLGTVCWSQERVAAHKRSTCTAATEEEKRKFAKRKRPSALKALLAAKGTSSLRYHLEKLHQISKASSSTDSASTSNTTEEIAAEPPEQSVENNDFMKMVNVLEQQFNSSSQVLPKSVIKAQFNCFTCNSELGSCRIPLSCRTETTQTPLKELLESIGDISLSRKNKSEGFLCNQCYTVVERFDYLQDQSRKVQVRLVGMLKRAQPEEIYIKEEPEESIDDEYELSNADESDDDDDWTEMHQSKRRRTSATKRRRTSARKIPNDEMKDEIDFNCKECSEKFKTDLCLQMHLATDHDRNEGEVDCPICFKTCKDRSSLKQHYTRHTLPRSLLCGQCGATFAHKSSFDMHMLMHEDKKEFVCSIAGCSMKFISNGKLLRHLRVHSEEKPFECPDCPGKRFTQKYGLDLHMKNLHQSKDNQSEACKICGVRIASKAKMKLHLTKIHDVILDETNE